GAFVDIGVHQDGLVHVSAMSRNFVKDPREVVKSGDVVRVKVLEVDVPRKRISLTLRLEDDHTSASAEPSREGRDRGRPGGQRGGGAGRQQRGTQDRGTQGRGGQGGSAQRGTGAQRGGTGGGQGRDSRRQEAAPANSAMADALRRAGLTK